MNSIRCYGKLQYIIIMKEIIRDELQMLQNQSSLPMVPFVVTDGIILERILSGHIIKEKETKKFIISGTECYFGFLA